MTDTQLMINLAVCGAVILVSVALLILIKKNPRKNEKILARKELLTARNELAQLGKQEISPGKKHMQRAVRALNYARRLAQQIAYEDESTAGGGICDKVSAARELCVSLRREPGREKGADEAIRLVDEAVRAVDDVLENDKLIYRRR